MPDRWGPKVEALRRLIAPGSGATDAERDTAETKLKQILKAQHGRLGAEQIFDQFSYDREAMHPDFDAAFDRMFTTRDYVQAKRAGVNMEGEWTGRNMQDAIQMMVADLARRSAHLRRKRIGANEPKEWGKR